MAQGKHWCFTLNNPTPFDLLPPVDDWTYLVYGNEVGETGTPHWQGFVEFKKRLRITSLKKMMPRAHWEPKRGTSLQASDYCKKDGDFQEFGEISLPKNTTKKRNWAEAMAQAKAGDFDSMDPAILFPHYHAAKRIRQDYQKAPEPLDDVCGLWFVGPPGTGKSYAARQRYPDFYDKPCNKWFDGYQGEETVIIDDFDTLHSVLGHHLKRWTDRYAFPAEHKGTTIQIRPKRIIVTSNYTIAEIFYEDPVLIEALSRRFTVEHFNNKYISN